MISPNPYRPRARKRSGVGIAFFAVLALLVFGVVLYFKGPLSSLAVSALKPALAARSNLSKSTVAELEAELASSTLALADRSALVQENQNLKLLLGRAPSKKEVLAGILLRPPATPYDTLLIDAGSNNGVAEGALVYGGTSAVIGQVSGVFPTSARVTLLSAPGHDYDAEVLSSATPGSVLPLALVGQGGGSLSGQVPAGSSVSVGDSIVVPGVSGSYVGTVTHIDSQAGASFETLYAQLPANLFSLEYVEVEVP